MCASSDGCLTADGVGVAVHFADGSAWHFTPSNPAELVSQLRACPEIGPDKVVMDAAEQDELDAVVAAAPRRISDMCTIL